MSTLRGFLDIRPGERRNTFAAFATLLAVTHRAHDARDCARRLLPREDAGVAPAVDVPGHRRDCARALADQGSSSGQQGRRRRRPRGGRGHHDGLLDDHARRHGEEQHPSMRSTSGPPLRLLGDDPDLDAARSSSHDDPGEAPLRLHRRRRGPRRGPRRAPRAGDHQHDVARARRCSWRRASSSSPRSPASPSRSRSTRSPCARAAAPRRLRSAARWAPP